MTRSQHDGSSPVDYPKSVHPSLCECKLCKEIRKLKDDLADAQLEVLELLDKQLTEHSHHAQKHSGWHSHDSTSIAEYALSRLVVADWYELNPTNSYIFRPIAHPKETSNA